MSLVSHVPRVVDPPIIVTGYDLRRLQAVLDLYDNDAAFTLLNELDRATVVDPDQVPTDLVTMDSKVVYEDCVSGTQRTVRLVYPKDANAAESCVSVLAPIGSALLGLRVGQEIQWRMPSGRRRFRIVAISDQPEARGEDLI